VSLQKRKTHAQRLRLASGARTPSLSYSFFFFVLSWFLSFFYWFSSSLLHRVKRSGLPADTTAGVALAASLFLLPVCAAQGLSAVHRRSIIN